MSDRKQTFIMHDNWAPLIKSMTDEQAGQLLKGIYQTREGEEHEAFDSPMLEGFFQMVMNFIGKADAAYEQKCEQLRANATKNNNEKADASKCSTQKANASKCKQMQADASKCTLNDNDNDNEYDNDNDKDNDRDIKDISPEPSSRLETSCEPLPLNSGEDWRPTEEEFAEYVRLYPGVDVQSEFRKMRGWLISNPTRRKTKTGIKRFVTSWLSREQDNQRISQRASPTHEEKTTVINSSWDYLVKAAKGEA